MILVSACLLGCACRYDGRSKGHPLAQELARRGLAVPVCPEQLGGLATPRAPSEQREGRVVSAAGDDVTAQYRRGAEETLRLARLYGCAVAVLKERSPSCGSGQVYDGASWSSSSGSWASQDRNDLARGTHSGCVSCDFHKKSCLFSVRFGKNTNIH